LNALLPRHQEFIDRFVVACQADSRVLAAFLGGSHAREEADQYSDLDLYLVTTDEDFQAFLAGKRVFLRQLGDVPFLEDFNIPNMLFFILSEGIEGELGIGRRSQFEHIHVGPYRLLLDKAGILEGARFQAPVFEPEARLRFAIPLINGFWHDLGHFIVAIGRGQLWWAYSQIEVLRGICMNLMRLQEDFRDFDAGDEAGFKIEQAVPPEQLVLFNPTYCPLETDALLHSVYVLIDIYRPLAQDLGHRHGIPYPLATERLLLRRLKYVKWLYP